MKILVTGSSGMLGSELCGVLGDDHLILGLDIVPPGEGVARPGQFHQASIVDREEVDRVLQEQKPDVVLHAAAWTDVDGCERDPEKAYAVNVTGTENIARGAGSTGAPVIFVSTDFVFDGGKGRPYREEDEASPISVYGRTKKEAEEAVMRDAGECIIVRTSWLFGRNGRNFVDTILRKAGDESVLRVVSDQTGTPTYARDLAGAISRLLAEAGRAGRQVYHVSNSGYCSWYEFAVQILREAGVTGTEVVPISSSALDRPARRPAYSVLDCSRFEKTAACRMRPWEEALSEYVKERYG